MCISQTCSCVCTLVFAFVVCLAFWAFVPKRRICGVIWALLKVDIVFRVIGISCSLYLAQHVRQKSLLKYPALYSWGAKDEACPHPNALAARTFVPFLNWESIPRCKVHAQPKINDLCPEGVLRPNINNSNGRWAKRAPTNGNYPTEDAF